MPKLDGVFRNAADALTMTERWHAAGVALHLVDMGGSDWDYLLSLLEEKIALWPH